jgi:hypothetical protein
MRVLYLVIGVVIGAGIIAYLDYGTLDPCGMMRQKLRREAIAKGGSLGGFLASAMPDNVLDGVVSAEYGKPVTPGFCIGVLLGTEKPAEAGRR